MNKGFTLVELSIVLVIIGLLIGGILVAQSMVGTSKIAAQVSQIQQFDAGVMSFKANYKFIPGDAPTFGGNGDGMIAYTAPWNGAIARFGSEIADFWNNWSPSDYSRTGLTQYGVAPLTSGASKNVPLAKFGKKGSYVIASATSATYGGLNADTSNIRNFYAILDPSNAQIPGSLYYSFNITGSSNSAITPVDLSALDTKMDDGNANNGNVIAGSIGNGGGIGAVNTTPLANCSNTGTGVYVVTNGGYECTALIRIGAQAGDVQ